MAVMSTRRAKRRGKARTRSDNARYRKGVWGKARLKAKGESEQRRRLEGVTKISLEVVGGALGQRRVEGAAERNLEAGEVEP